MNVTEVIFFANELDMLEAHLVESRKLFDRIIVVEGPKTITGVSKPLYFDNNKSRFEKYGVEHLILPDILFPFVEGEGKVQYDGMRINDGSKKVWLQENLKIDTKWVMYADCDEILDVNVIDSWKYVLDQDYEHISLKYRSYLMDVNFKTGSNLDIYRLIRSDLPPDKTSNPKICKRVGVGTRKSPIGRHFESCLSPEQVVLKAQCRAWYFGVNSPLKVPTADFFAGRRERGQDYISGRPLEQIGEVESIEHHPEFMKKNIGLFPHRELI